MVTSGAVVNPGAEGSPISNLGARAMGEETDRGTQQSDLLGPHDESMKGRKCLVLDLDETLVHSSFKVRLHHCLLFSLFNLSDKFSGHSSSRFRRTCRN